ncbi:helix-turn-helix domain-containing protein, partial [Vibrio parahaemolyticus]|nr:helix-turn-helix domain-containing protein [Vibrio parahaemolyticus]
MDNKFPNVGENLRLLRQEMGISLDKASKMTGVSKAMLGQIERGESSPTVSTLWKISSGFKINFTTLLNENTNTYEVIKKEEVEPIVEQKGNMKLYPIYPFSP